MQGSYGFSISAAKVEDLSRRVSPQGLRLTKVIWLVSAQMIEAAPQRPFGGAFRLADSDGCAS